MSRFLLIPLVMSLLSINCSSAGTGKITKNTEKGKNVVLVLYKSTPFKDNVIREVSANVSQKNIKVIRDLTGNAGKYNSSDYGAVVYMAEYWAWHTPLHAKKYFNKNKESRNTLFFITSGDPDVKIRKPFDAVTSASKNEKIKPVSDEITEKLFRILNTN